jgi:tetratricopeptide (TPR) repeat protein
MGAVTLLRTSDTTQAQQYFNKAEALIPVKKKQIKPEHAVLLTKMAEAQLYSKVVNFPRAFGYITKATAIDNTNPQIPLALGEIHMTQNNASEALKAYNRAAYLNPNWPVPKIKIGDIYMRVPNLQMARPLFEEARDIDATFAPVYRSLGELYYKAGMYELSNQNFEKFIELSGNNTPAKLRYANSMFKAGNYAGALSVYEDILQVDQSRNYLNRVAAYSAYDVKPPQLEKAQQYIETFLANEDPENIIWRDYAYYGRILYRMSNFTDSAMLSKSFTQFMKAYEMDPSNLVLVNELAMNFYNGRWYEGAIQMLNKKAELNEKGLSTQEKELLGRSYYQMDQLNEAKKYLPT